MHDILSHPEAFDHGCTLTGEADSLRDRPLMARIATVSPGETRLGPRGDRASGGAVASELEPQ